MKGHAYLKKPVAESCRFVKISLTSQWSQGTKGLSKEWNEIKEILPPQYSQKWYYLHVIFVSSCKWDKVFKNGPSEIC